MYIIPAIDIIDGACVRLTKGAYDTKKVYAKDPLDMAKKFQDHGLRRLHVVDLDGAKGGHIVNYRTLERIAGHTSLIIDFGGGLKSAEDLRIAFESGAAMVTGGSIAVKNPEELERWILAYGGEKIILGADSKDGYIAVQGWTEVDKEHALIPFIAKWQQAGITQVIATDIAKDGTLEGPAIKLYREMLAQLPRLQLIASGGVSKMADLYALADIGMAGAIVGKALYEGRITLQELEKWVLGNPLKAQASSAARDQAPLNPLKAQASSAQNKEA